MNAQQITLDHDPETAATDLPSNDNNCCCGIKSILCCPCSLIYWYLSPLTCNLCYTLKIFVFHALNFALAIFLMVWDITFISVGIGIIPCCFIGIPFLWISIEIIIALSRFDLGILNINILCVSHSNYKSNL